jgi:hypothetical protein
MLDTRAPQVVAVSVADWNVRAGSRWEWARAEAITIILRPHPKWLFQVAGRRRAELKSPQGWTRWKWNEANDERVMLSDGTFVKTKP